MPNYGYNTGIPDGPNNPSEDQPDMKENTDSNDSIWVADHFGFNDNKGGRHKQVSLTNESAPGLLDSSNGVLYANVFNGNSWPVWQNLLGSTILMSFATNDAANGYVSLPGGLLLQWGRVAGSNASTVPVSFSLQFTKASVATAAYFVIPIPVRAATNPGTDFATVVVTGSVTSSGFSIGNIGGHTIVNWYWMAIGPKS